MHKRIVGPVAMITVGLLFLLDEFTRFGFHRTWPILLIAIGTALVIQRSAGTDTYPSAPMPADSGPETNPEKR